MYTHLLSVFPRRSLGTDGVMPFIIAIDGPAGSGKSTVASTLAAALELRHVDTGAMYRAFTLKVLHMGLPVEGKELLAQLAADTEITLEGGKVTLDGEDVTVAIRSPEVDATVSAVAAHAGVREVMVARQRELVRGGAVVEGRDIGTVVLPDADLKIFLTASTEERARRRHAENVHRFEDHLENIEKEMQERDALDSGREVSPLKPASDAITIDSTDLPVQEVIDAIIALLPLGERDE